MSNPYETIFVTPITEGGFQFEDAFGFECEVLYADTFEQVVDNFKELYPHTAERAFKLLEQ